MATEDRCELMHNIDSWPYIKRCTNESTTVRDIQESCDADTIEIKVCDHCAQMISSNPPNKA